MKVWVIKDIWEEIWHKNGTGNLERKTCCDTNTYLSFHSDDNADFMIRYQPLTGTKATNSQHNSRHFLSSIFCSCVRPSENWKILLLNECVSFYFKHFPMIHLLQQLKKDQNCSRVGLGKQWSRNMVCVNIILTFSNIQPSNSQLTCSLSVSHVFSPTEPNWAVPVSLKMSSWGNKTGEKNNMLVLA